MSLLRDDVVSGKLTLAAATDRMVKAGGSPALQAKLPKTVKLAQEKAAAKAATKANKESKK